MALSDHFPEMKGWTSAPPSDSQKPQMPTPEVQSSPYLRATLPLPMQYAPDTLKQYNRPGLSSFRIAPLPPGGAPALNSASASVVHSSIQEFINVAAAGPNGSVQFNSSGALSGSNLFSWDSVSSTLHITGSLTVTTPIAVSYGGTGSNLSVTGGTSQVLRQSSVGVAVTVSQLAFTDISGILGVINGGTGANLSATGGVHQVVQQSSVGGVFSVSQLAFTDISGSISISQTPLTTLGDILYVNSVPALTRLAGNTTSQKQYLSQTGTGAISASPVWAQIAAADISNGTTGSGAIVLSNTPTLITPVLGVATATSIDASSGFKQGGTATSGHFLRGNGSFFVDSAITATDLSGVAPGIVATVNLTAQTANIGATTLYAVPASGIFRVSAYVVETTAGSVSSTLPNVQIIYTDIDTGTSITIDATPILGVAGIGQTGSLTSNTVGTASSGVIVVAAKISTNIQYQTVNYASTAAGMAYSLRLRLEAM